MNDTEQALRERGQRMSVFCPKCYPNGIMYAGSITWKLCRSCVADESAEYGQGRRELSKIEERVQESQAMHPCSESSTFKSVMRYILEGGKDG